MGTKSYIGVGNVARQVKGIYIGVDDIARKVKKVYVGVNGIAELIFEKEYAYVKLIGHALRGAYVNETVESIGAYAFYECSGLTSVDFPNATSISRYAFGYCRALTTADFPNVTSIDIFAFYVCISLTSANFPNVTSISNYAFATCTSLTTADFPSVTSVGSSVFVDCKALTSVILRSTTMARLDGTSAFNNTPIKNGTGYIYVPSALIASYQSASNWSTYSAQFRALEDYTIDGTITGELDASKI